MTCSEIARLLGIDRAAVFRHLRDLEGRGVIVGTRTSRLWIYYAIPPPPESCGESTAGGQGS